MHIPSRFSQEVHRQVVLVATPTLLFRASPLFLPSNFSARIQTCISLWDVRKFGCFNPNHVESWNSFSLSDDDRFFVCLFFCFCVAPECNKPLGMQDGTISDGQISASSERSLYFGPENARLNFGGTSMRVGAWVARKRDRNQWLQVDFGNETIVTGIDTQGRKFCGECHDFVKNYTVSYSQDSATFHQYKENGNYTKVENSVDSTLSVSWMSWGSRALFVSFLL